MRIRQQRKGGVGWCVRGIDDHDRRIRGVKRRHVEDFGLDFVRPVSSTVHVRNHQGVSGGWLLQGVGVFAPSVFSTNPCVGTIDCACESSTAAITTAGMIRAGARFCQGRLRQCQHYQLSYLLFLPLVRFLSFDAGSRSRCTDLLPIATAKPWSPSYHFCH